MARLLNHSLPNVETEYNSELVQKAFRDIEIALTDTEMPSKIEGQDENNALTWFLG
jgi:hypothetical protein|tara:strand:+ start:1066 stop:1233 length:168 start_codon:yes stop_codon:yes gene_type:complete